MRHKGLGVCATHNGMQKRRFHLKEVLAVHVAADCGNNLAALDKRALDLGVCNKVNVALTITQLFVGQAVELFRQRTQALRQKLKAARGNGKLTALRAHHGAVHANPVTHVQVLYTLVQILAQVVDLEEQLNVARGVTQTEERALALHALRHNAAGNRNGIFRGLAIGKIGVSRIQVGHMMGVVESMAVRVLARRNQRSTLGLANLNGIIFNHLLLCVVLTHRNSPSGKRRRKPDRFCVRFCVQARIRTRVQIRATPAPTATLPVSHGMYARFAASIQHNASAAHIVTAHPFRAKASEGRRAARL